MSQISALIAGKNKNYDYQLSALARFILNAGVSGSTGLEVTSGNVAAGEAFILATRTNGQQIMVHYQNTANVAIDTSGTTKVWVGLDQSVVDDGSSNAVDGTGIATIRTGASYPAGNYLPLASITGGVITDERSLISLKNILREGFGINKHVRVNRSTGVEEEKNVTDGATLLSTDKIRVEKAGGDYEDMPFSVFSGALSPNSLVWNPSAIIAENLAINDGVALQDIPASTETQLGWQNVGDVAGNAIITMYAYSTGVSSNTLKLRTDKVSPTQNFAVRIVTTAGGVATTTQVDANAIKSIAPASVTAGGELTITFPGSFSCGARGTKIAIQVCQGTFVSPVTGANYYKVGYGIGTTVSSNSFDVTTTQAIGAYQGGLTAAWSTTFTTNRVIKLKTVVSEVSVPSGVTVTITVGGVQALQFVTSGASATITIPNGGIIIGSGKTVVVGTSSWNASSYHTMGEVNDANINVGSQNTPFYIFTSTGYAEYNMTSSLIENIVAQKSICALLSTRHRLAGFTAGGGSMSSITPTLYREGVLGGFSGLTRDSTYYLSDTAGLISLTSSSPAQKVGVALSTTELDIKTRYSF